MRTADLVSFMLARDARRRFHHTSLSAKQESKRPPADAILDTYRFCNVLRNDDRVTKWLHEHWLPIAAPDMAGWFMFAVARCAINRIDTMAAITDAVLPWNPNAVRRILKKRRDEGLTIYGAAYMIGTQGNAGDKVDFLIDKVLTPLWKNRQGFPVGSLALAHKWLDDHYAVGSFTAAQVLADWKYAAPTLWDDFATFAASGPGSRRGLNRVCDRPLETAWKEEQFREVLTELRRQVLPLINRDKHLRQITAQDLQNCLCEFDKYERARLGEGRPKQLYAPHKENK